MRVRRAFWDWKARRRSRWAFAEISWAVAVAASSSVWEEEGREEEAGVEAPGVERLEEPEKGRTAVAISARVWLALCAACLAWPLSSFKILNIACVSSALSSGLSQNVHGPSPSFAQTILPQEIQFGAAARSGCRWAMQSQRRAAFSAGVRAEREGFVESSRLRMAESRSFRTVEAPRMEVPPAIAILVFDALDGVEERGTGEEAREDLAEEMSEIRAPVAEGGSLGVWREVLPAAVGSWRASGFSWRARVFASGGSLRALVRADM